tara:strand:- start:890 stop:1666 length:777 start_codon:yes stop_codon:yes gene_type:complete
VPFPIRPSTAKTLFGNVAQQSHYEVRFQIPGPVVNFLATKGISPIYCVNDLGLLCNSTTLPTSAFATTESNPYQGIRQKFAHTRVYTDITMEFYVDKRYEALKVLEHWMDFISGGADGEVSKAANDYFIKMRYPEDYKSTRTKIIKFERDYRREIEYTFIGLFPKSLSAVPVSYGSSDVLKVAATFDYDRYIAGRASSVNYVRGDSENTVASERRPVEGRTPQRGASGIVWVPKGMSYHEASLKDQIYKDPRGSAKTW